MKKRLLLVLSLIAVFVCLFAISASAVEIDGIYYDISGTGDSAVAKVNTQNRSLCELETVNIPEYVEQTANGVTTRYKVVEIYSSAFGSTSGSTSNNQFIKHLVVPSTVSSIGTHAFRNLANLETVVLKSKSETGVEFLNAQFYGCSELTSVDMKDSDITVLGAHCFRDCSKLTTVKVSPKLKTLGERSFQGCSQITELDLSYTQLQDIKGLWDVKVTKLVLPSTVTTIRGNGIQSTNISTMVLPHGITNLEQNCLANNYSLYLLVFPVVSENATINSNLFNGATPEVVIYPGNNTDVSYTKLTGTGGPFAGYTVKHISEYDSTKTYTGKNFFYGATTCSKCNGLFATEEEQVYFTDYLSGFSKGKLCTNCEKVDATQESDAMFTFEGFSIPENGDAGFVVKYTVNNEAIELYESLTGKTVSYGLYAATEEQLEDGDIFDANGMPQNGAVKAEVTTGFMMLKLKVAGFETDEQKAAGLALGVYVETIKDEEKEYTFLNQEKPNEGEKYFFVSYNYVKNAISK